MHELMVQLTVEVKNPRHAETTSVGLK